MKEENYMFDEEKYTFDEEYYKEEDQQLPFVTMNDEINESSIQPLRGDLLKRDNMKYTKNRKTADKKIHQSSDKMSITNGFSFGEDYNYFDNADIDISDFSFNSDNGNTDVSYQSCDLSHDQFVNNPYTNNKQVSNFNRHDQKSNLDYTGNTIGPDESHEKSRLNYCNQMTELDHLDYQLNQSNHKNRSHWPKLPTFDKDLKEENDFINMEERYVFDDGHVSNEVPCKIRNPLHNAKNARNSQRLINEFTSHSSYDLLFGDDDDDLPVSSVTKKSQLQNRSKEMGVSQKNIWTKNKTTNFSKTKISALKKFTSVNPHHVLLNGNESMRLSESKNIPKHPPNQITPSSKTIYSAPSYNRLNTSTVPINNKKNILTEITNVSRVDDYADGIVGHENEKLCDFNNKRVQINKENYQTAQIKSCKSNEIYGKSKRESKNAIGTSLCLDKMHTNPSLDASYISSNVNDMDNGSGPGNLKILTVNKCNNWQSSVFTSSDTNEDYSFWNEKEFSDNKNQSRVYLKDDNFNFVIDF